MEIIRSSVLYENPLPQLKSRQSFFPSLCQLSDGIIAASFVIGEAFESVDSTSYICFSQDEGATWSEPKKMFSLASMHPRITDYCKITALPDGRIAALGYAYLRSDPSLPIGNPETGGLLDDFVFCSFSEDRGQSWSNLQKISCSWGPHVEASAPITVLKDGTWISPITGFPDWEGNLSGSVCGRALRSEDLGETWNDDVVCMAFPNRSVCCYEQRMCQLDSGTIISIAWNEDLITGERMPNHYTVSYDNGQSFSSPISSGICGQASSLCALGGEKFLSLHAVRRDTDQPGIYGYVIDFSEKTWNVVDDFLIWKPAFPIVRDQKMADIFAFLKFGQPSAIQLQSGDLLMTHWYCENGVYRVAATKMQLS